MQVVVPSPDASGYWHYVYVVHDPDTGEWYGGKHSTNKLEDGYRGSGRWLQRHPRRRELLMEIVAFLPNAPASRVAEVALIDLGDSLCRNETEGGDGLGPEGARRAHVSRVRNGIWKPRLLAGIAKRSADPKWQEKHAAFLAGINSNPAVRASQAAGYLAFCATPAGRQVRLAAGRKRRNHPDWDASHARAVAATSKPEVRKKAGETHARNNAAKGEEYLAWRRQITARARAAKADKRRNSAIPAQT